MTDSTEDTKVQIEAISGQIRSMERCSIITPETRFQSGFRADGHDFPEGPRRLFFGDHTEEESISLYAQLKLDGLAVSVVVSGYSKYRENAYGVYFDDSVLFVEKLTLLS